MRKYMTLTLAAFTAISISACKPSMPEVNDENCKPANIKALDESIRADFASKCLRR